MPDPDPLLSQISDTAHETCLFNRVRRELLKSWFEDRIGTDISAKFKPRRSHIVFRGSRGKLKVAAHALALIDANRHTLTWAWALEKPLGNVEPSFAHALRAAGVQRGLQAFDAPILDVSGADLSRIGTEVCFAAISLLGREYLAYEVPIGPDGSIGLFILEFDDEEPPMPTSEEISARLDQVLGDSFDPLASLEGLVDTEPGWRLAELNATQHILRDPMGNEHIVEGLRHCAMA
ncbi:DUF6882 domain-containing protein [Corynebacterium epidermidicanis]|nr:DUF6882 domain-containing protein [Corynebacterium epidermidicanis]